MRSIVRWQNIAEYDAAALDTTLPALCRDACRQAAAICRARGTERLSDPEFYRLIGAENSFICTPRGIIPI